MRGGQGIIHRFMRHNAWPKVPVINVLVMATAYPKFPGTDYSVPLIILVLVRPCVLGFDSYRYVQIMVNIGEKTVTHPWGTVRSGDKPRLIVGVCQETKEKRQDETARSRAQQWEIKRHLQTSNPVIKEWDVYLHLGLRSVKWIVSRKVGGDQKTHVKLENVHIFL